MSKQYACVGAVPKCCGESYLPARCQVAFPILASSAAPRRARPSVHCDHTPSVHNTRSRPQSTMPAAKNASKKKNDKDGLAVKKTVKTKAAPKPKKEKKPKAPKPKAAPKKKVNLFLLFLSLTNFCRLQQRNNLDLKSQYTLTPVPVHCCNILFKTNE